MVVLVLIFAFALILLETTFLNFPITLVLMAFLSLGLSSFKKTFLLAFLIGLLYDFFAGGLVGQTALVFLTLSVVALFYRRKFIETHLIFEIAFYIFSYKLWQVVTGEAFSWKSLVMVAALGFSLMALAKRIGLIEIRRDDLLAE